MRVKKSDEGLIETRGSENGEKGFDQRVTDSIVLGAIWLVG